jgi:hypothetical protein
LAKEKHSDYKRLIFDYILDIRRMIVKCVGRLNDDIKIYKQKYYQVSVEFKRAESIVWCVRGECDNAATVVFFFFEK